VFQRAVVVTINTVVVSVIFEPVVNIASKTIVLDVDVEVENFTSVNIVLATIAAVSAIVAHRSEDYDRLSVFLSLSFACLYSYASVTFTTTLSRRRLMCVCLSFFCPIVCAKAQLRVTIRPPSSTKPDSDTCAPNETLRTYFRGLLRHI